MTRPPYCHSGGRLCPGAGQSSPCRPPSPSDQSDRVRTGADGGAGAPQATSGRGYTASRLEGAGGEHPRRGLEPSASRPWRGSRRNEPCGNVFVTPAPAGDHRGPCSLYLVCPSWHPGLLHRGPDWHSGGPGHSFRVPGEGRIWNRGTLKQTQHGCHTHGGLGRARAPRSAQAAPESRPASAVTSVPRGWRRHQEVGTSSSLPTAPRSLTPTWRAPVFG